MSKAKRFMRLNRGLKSIALLWGIAGSHPLLAAPSSEIQVLTVAYLNNFMKLSEWPTTQDKELTLCVTQEGELAKELDSLVDAETQPHTLKIKRLLQGDNASQCHLLYLSKDEKPLLVQSWLNSLKDLPVLTVSDKEDFLDQGGMVALIEQDGRLQFEVNLTQVEHVKIKMSSKMLQIARDVRKK